MIKGKLRSSSKIVDLPEDEKPNINNNSPIIAIEYETISWSKIILSWVKSIAGFFGLALILLLGIYTGMSATIMYITIPPGTNDPIIVARDTYVGGDVPAGEIVYVNVNDKLEDTIISNTLEGFTGVNNGALVRVHAGPVARIAFDTETGTTIVEGETVVEGIPTNVEADKNILNKEFLVECLVGECETGEYLIISQEQISGEYYQGKEGK